MKITYVISPDWHGIYVDGKLKCQNHALSAIEALQAIGVEFKVLEADDDWMYQVRQLPENEAEIVEAK